MTTTIDAPGLAKVSTGDPLREQVGNVDDATYLWLTRPNEEGGEG